jgi:hypothetical protein
MQLLGAGSEWFWTMLEFIVVAVTAILIYGQIRIQTNGHIIAATESLVTQWNSDRVIALRKVVCRAWLENDHSFSPAAQSLAEVFEKFGLYAKIKVVPDEIMWDSLSWYAEYYHHMFEDGIEQARGQFKDNTLFENFDLLCERFKKVNASRSAPNFERPRTK